MGSERDGKDEGRRKELPLRAHVGLSAPTCRPRPRRHTRNGRRRKAAAPARCPGAARRGPARPGTAGPACAQRRRCTLRLVAISLKNFKSFKDEVTIPLKQVTCLIGPNGAGKSNVLYGLKTLASIVTENDCEPKPGDYFDSDATREMRLAAVVELADYERKAIAKRIKRPSAALLHGDLGNWLFKRLKYEVSLQDTSNTHAISLTFTDENYHTFIGVTKYLENYTAERRDIKMIDMVGGNLPDLQSFVLRSTRIDSLLGQIDKSLAPTMKGLFLGISHIDTQRSIPQSSSPHESRAITPDGSNILNEINSLPLEKKIEFNKFLESITDRSLSSVETIMRGSELVLEATEPGLSVRTTLAEFSSGQEQLVLLALQLFTRPGTIFILTEPELHLHTRAQKQVQRRIREASSRLQIIIETHSPIFLGSDHDEAVLLITKSGGFSHVTPIGPGNMDVIRHELGAGHRDSLYHENILFVEGASEHAAFPMLMSTLGHDPAPRTVVFNLGGVGRIKHLQLLLPYFKADGRRVFVILDESKAAHKYTKKLAEDGLLDKNFFVLEKNFEDAFASTTIVDAVKEVATRHKCEFSLTVEDLDTKRAAGRRVDAVLQENWKNTTGHNFSKIDLAKLLAVLPSCDIPDEIKSALRAAAAHFGHGTDGDHTKGNGGGENPA